MLYRRWNIDEKIADLVYGFDALVNLNDKQVGHLFSTVWDKHDDSQDPLVDSIIDIALSDYSNLDGILKIIVDHLKQPGFYDVIDRLKSLQKNEEWFGKYILHLFYVDKYLTLFRLY